MPFGFQDAYDELNPADDDYRFYLELAVAHGARRVVDLGCGTGALARLLARHGIDVLAVDPDPEMLRVARAGSSDPGAGGSVEWRLGDSAAVGPAGADLAVMSGHVAQVFLDDRSWQQTLVDLRTALAPGGRLAFESRNPAHRRWEEWTRAQTLRAVTTPDGEVEFWHETVAVDLPLVTYDTFTRNVLTGEQSVTRDVLAFRDERALRRSVEQTGFAVDAVLGSWDRRPVSADSPELIVVARAAGS
ncbi:MAG: class I SAM-dependent methyltransferase [Motilibacteraceae bacterium]